MDIISKQTVEGFLAKERGFITTNIEELRKERAENIYYEKPKSKYHK
jgi:hypothetical protein